MAKKDNSVVYIAVFIMAVIAVAGVLKLTGYGNELTGFGASLATIKMNISPSVDITLVDANISFGNGAVTAAASAAVVDTTAGSVTLNGSWSNSLNDPFWLENTGNVVANVSVAAANTAAAWIGGSTGGGPAFFYNYSSNKTAPLNSCLMDGAWANATWSSAMTTTAVSMCNKFNFSDTSDALRFDLKIIIPGDAAMGAHTNQFTFSATMAGP